MNAQWLCVTLLACSALFACKEKAPEPTASEAPAMPTAPAIQSSAPPLDTEKLVIPTEEDFESEAELSISSKNLNEELDKLEREINRL